MSSGDKPKLMGYIKKDKDQLWAKLVVRVNNLSRNRDEVKVFYPNNKFEALVVTVNDETMMDKLLPNEIIRPSCEHKVSYGRKGKIKIKLRKAEPSNWMTRWSPSRENQPPPSLVSDSLTSNSNGQSEHSEDSDFPGLKIEEL